MNELETFLDLQQRNAAAANELLYRYLRDLDTRDALYHQLRKTQGALPFKSRVLDTKAGDTAYLLTDPAHIAAAIDAPAKGGTIFSSVPYRALGSGNFMLGLDDQSHQQQRALGMACLTYKTPLLAALSDFSFSIAALQPLKSERFDLAQLAEQAALRFGGLLFGYDGGDLPLLQQAMRAGFLDLNFQIFGRHFFSDHDPKASAPLLQKLGGRTIELLGLYGPVDTALNAEQAAARAALVHEREEVAARLGLNDWVPVLQSLSRAQADDTPTQRAAIALGLLAGTIGNVQAAVCHVLESIFAQPPGAAASPIPGIDEARKLALSADSALVGAISAILAQRPPAAFLPRKLRDTWHSVKLADGRTADLPAGTELLLGMGSASREDQKRVFGGGLHSCIGEHLAMPLIHACVRGVLKLPGLAQQLNAETGRPVGVGRTWGFKVDSYPFSYARGLALGQQPLNVVMRIKAPVAENAQRLRTIIRYGVPRIESALAQSRHVHFAWFTLQDNEQQLALHTCYDGDFDAYIEHFALEVGPLFDRIFAHIEEAPPMPVSRFPKEFVETIRRFNRAPVEGYFFSAYPARSVASIGAQP